MSLDIRSSKIAPGILAPWLAGNLRPARESQITRLDHVLSIYPRIGGDCEGCGAGLQ